MSKKGFKEYKKGWKFAKKKPSLESFVSAALGGGNKDKGFWGSVTGVLTDIAGFFSPSEAQKLRRIANEAHGASDEKLLALLKENGIKTAELTKAYDKAVNQVQALQYKPVSAATVKHANKWYDKATEDVANAQKKMNAYANKSATAVNEIYSGLTGEKDISDRYNKLERIIKDKE